MLRAAFGSVTGRSRADNAAADPPAPSRFSWLHQRLIPFLQALSSRACRHPIYNVAFVAVIASTAYITLLESSLFEPPHTSHAVAGQVDVPTLLLGSKTLHLGDDSAWKWQNGDDQSEVALENVSSVSSFSPDCIRS